MRPFTSIKQRAHPRVAGRLVLVESEQGPIRERAKPRDQRGGQREHGGNQAHFAPTFARRRS